MSKVLAFTARSRTSLSRAVQSDAVLAGLGLASCLPYLYALSLGDLRKNTAGALLAYFGAFILYWAVVAITLRRGTQPDNQREPVRWYLLLFPLLFNAILLFSFPALSDDMFRYLWDGRVQNAGISPYLYPPNAEGIASLRDPVIWQHINRKWAVTVYPPGAEIIWALLWRLAPDSILAFKGASVLGGLLAGWLLIKLTSSMNLSPYRALIFIWHPLLVFELAHSGHLDGLLLPMLVGALYARRHRRDGLVGLLLGAATLIKFYPLVLFPALWRPRNRRGRWATVAGFAIAMLGGYGVYWTRGGNVLGFLPLYFSEQFNAGLAAAIHQAAGHWMENTDAVVNGVLFGGLALLGLIFGWRPANSPDGAIRRCLWTMGWFALFTHNLMPWYLLWMLPCLAMTLKPGRFLGLRMDGQSGWLLFTGLVTLSYTFFIDWTPLPWVVWVEYLPLYFLLLFGGVRWWRAMRN